MNFQELLDYISKPSRFQAEHNLSVKIEVCNQDDESALVKKISTGEKYGVAFYFCYNRMAWSNGQDWVFMCPTTKQMKDFISWFIPCHDETQKRFNRGEDRILPWLARWIGEKFKQVTF